MSNEQYYDQVFLEVDVKLPELIGSYGLWEDQNLIDNYHDIRNQLVDFIVKVKTMGKPIKEGE